MKPQSSPSRRRRTRLIVAGGAIALYAITGFLILPPILRSQATDKLSEALHRPVTIEKISLNPFAFSITVRGFSVADHDGAELAGFDAFHANFQLSSLFRWMWYFSEVSLERPRGRIVVAADGTLNIADLAPPPATEPAPAEPAPPPRFLIGTLAVSAGSLDFSDNSRASPFNTTVGPVTVSLHNFGTGSGEAGNIALQGSTESGERFAFDGALHLNDLNLVGRFTMTGLHAPKYDPFHRTTTLFEVASGKISFDVRFTVNAKGGLVWNVDPAEFAIEELRIRARGETVDAIYLPALLVSGVRADSATRTATVARVALEAFPEGTAPAWTVQGADPAAAAKGVTTVRLTRLPDGSLDLATLLTPRIEPTAAQTAPEPASPAWSAAIAEVSVKDARIELNDITNPRPVHLLIDQLNTVARNLSTDPAAEIAFEAALRWQEQGTVRAQGTATREPLGAKVEFEAADLLLAALDPYLEPFAAVRLADGAARASGTITLSQESGAAEPSLAFAGAAGLDRLDVKTADGETPLSSLGSLDLRDIKFKSPPVALDIAEVAIRSPKASLIIAADGTLNLATVSRQPDPSAPADTDAAAPAPADAETAAPRPVITIGRVVIEDGRADVADRSMAKEFTTSLRDFGGTISGLSSAELARADVDLKGTLDGTAPFQVSGKINPLSEDAFTDLRVDFRGIGLAAFTPYSGKFVGYTIDRGRLTLDLTYHLSARVLEAENKLEFDQFYLGETVESPDAMKLPLKLALGLLRDRSGKIDIDLPIRGNLDDPDFKYGSLVWKAIGNLIAKAATAPFSLLGKLIPGGGDPETLSYVEFAPGAAEIDTASTEKLLTLAGALYDRPALVLEIVSAPAPELDAPPLRAARFEAILEERRAAKVAAAGPAPAAAPVAAPTAGGERETLIREAFAEAFPGEIAPPAAAVAEASEDGKSGVVVRTFRRLFGTEPEPEPAPLPVAPPGEVPPGPTLAEMEARLLEQVEIPPAELEALAASRANAVRERLIATEKVEAERLVVAAPAEPASVAAAPRVTFGFK